MKTNLLIKLSFAIFLAFVVAFATTFYIFRSQMIESAKSKAYAISELVRDTLTYYMVIGIMDRRDEFLNNIRQIEGVEEIRVIRGKGVVEQFGKGMEFEVPRYEIEKAVLESGKTKEVLQESFKDVKYRIVIPYKADPVKGVNCLQCHKAKPGEVLGAISLTMDITPMRSRGLQMSLWIFLAFSLAFGFVIFFTNSLLTKIVQFLKDMTQALSLMGEGKFQHDIRTDLGHEVGDLVKTFKNTCNRLQNNLSSMEEKVVSMIGERSLKTGDVLSDTSKIVDELLRIYKFKKTIEKDKSREDVYKRILQVIQDYMGLDKFSFYDVQRKKNRIQAIHVEGATSWCKDVIFERADECRAYRTGLDVDSREFLCICPNFINCKENKLHHYCIPIYVGGSVQYVLQLVYEPEMEPFVNLVIPYIKGYLEEATPILEAKAYMDALREQSLRDQLTGLYNRRFLDETIDKIAAQIRRRGTTLGILMVDVDYFKEVNDTYGHDVGDKVLKEVANVLSRSVRESDMVIRFGGEEFLVLLMDVQSGKSEEVAEKIRGAVESHTIESFGVVLRKTVSIGVSEFPKDSEKIWQCIKYADVALYKAKEMGRNRVVRFRPEFWTEGSY